MPTFVFKAVYDPRRRLAAAYLTQNTDDTGYEVISIAQLTRMAGTDTFPAVPAFLKEERPSLPAPRPHYAGRRRPLPVSQPSALQAIVDALFGETPR